MAPSEVKSWIEPLKHEILGAGDKHIVENEEVSKVNKRRYSILAGAKTDQKIIKKTIIGDNALKFIREGRIFISIEKTIDGDFESHRLFLIIHKHNKHFLKLSW